MYKFYIYPGNYSNLIKEGLLRRENWTEEDKEPLSFVNTQFVWKPTNLSVAGYNRLDSIVRSRPKNTVQVFNHFENILDICTKTGLVRSLKKYYKNHKEARKADYNTFDSIPASFIIRAGVEDREYSRFSKRFADIEKQSANNDRLPQKHCQSNFWLVKPANLNQGKGIKVFKNLSDINTFLRQKDLHSFWVVQKYLEKPLLYNSRKFDIRIWVSVSSKNEIFVYRKAYIRTSSEAFDLNNKNDHVHLTNNCLQQFGDNYGKHEDGNTLPIEVLDQYFEQLFPDKNVRLSSHIIPRIKDLIIDSFLCAKARLNPSNRQNVFEFLGYDFMIDEDLRTWLIEINTNPYLGSPNEYIQKLLPNFVDDLLDLNVDTHFPPKNPHRNGRPNDFELIYREQGSKHHNGPFSARSSFNTSLYPLQELAPPEFAKRNSQFQKNLEKYYQPKMNESQGLPNSEVRSVYESQHIQEFDQLRQTATDGGFGQNGSKMKLDDSAEELVATNSASHKGFNRPRVKTSKAKKDTLQTIYKNLHLASIYKTELENSSLVSELGIIMSALKNWELVSERKRKLAGQSLKLVAQSSRNGLLVAPNIIKTLTRLLRSQNVPVDVKLSIVESINLVGRELSYKKEVICSTLMHELIKICVSSCNEMNIHSYNSALLLTTLRCIINLGAIFFKKPPKFIDAKEFDQIKSCYIAQGGLIAIWIVANHSCDPEMREIAQNSFLGTADYKTLARQLQILEVLKIIPETDDENEDDEAEDISINDEGAIQQQAEQKKVADTSTIQYQAKFHLDSDIHHLDRMEGYKTGFTINDPKNSVGFPKFLLRFYTLEQLLGEFNSFVRDLYQIEMEKENDENEPKIIEKPERIPKEERKSYTNIEDLKKPPVSKPPRRSKKKSIHKMEQLQVYKSNSNNEKESSPFGGYDFTIRTRSVRALGDPGSQSSKRGISFDTHKRSLNNIDTTPKRAMKETPESSDSEPKVSRSYVSSGRKQKDIQQLTKIKNKVLETKNLTIQTKDKVPGVSLSAQRLSNVTKLAKQHPISWSGVNSENYNQYYQGAKPNNAPIKFPTISKANTANTKLKPLEQVTKAKLNVKPQGHVELNEYELLNYYQNPVDSTRGKDERLFNLSPIAHEKDQDIDDFE